MNSGLIFLLTCLIIGYVNFADASFKKLYPGLKFKQVCIESDGITTGHDKIRGKKPLKSFKACGKYCMRKMVKNTEIDSMNYNRNTRKCSCTAGADGNTAKDGRKYCIFKELAAWSEWVAGDCSTSCGDGTVKSTRKCEPGLGDCKGDAEKTEKCNLGACPEKPFADLGYCLDYNGNDQNTGQVGLPAASSHEACLNQCKDVEGVTACESYNNGQTCGAHTSIVARGNGDTRYKCWVFPIKTDKKISLESGWCQDTDGNDQNTGTIDIGRVSSDAHCLNRCKATIGVSGCESYKNGEGCTAHTSTVGSGSGDKKFKCWVWPVNADNIPFADLGYCLDYNGNDQNTGQVGLLAASSHEACLNQCRDVEGVTACESYNNGQTCGAHTSTVARGNGDTRYKCWVFPIKTDKKISLESGWCQDTDGNDQNTGTIDIGQVSSDAHCLNRCKATIGVSGCESYKNGEGCTAHTSTVGSGSGDNKFKCWAWPEKAGSWIGFDGIWGDWGLEEMCPDGQYAYGYSLKGEKNQGGGDDSALNAVKLLCGNEKDMTHITSTEGPWGSYSEEVSCADGHNNPITSFRMQIEENQGGGDDSAANNVHMRCQDGQDLKATAATNWGDLTEYVSCPADTAVAGIKTRVEGNQGSGDDTALNGVALFCKQLPKD